MTPDQIAEAHRLQDFFFAALGVRFGVPMGEVRRHLQPADSSSLLPDERPTEAAGGEVLPHDLPANHLPETAAESTAERKDVPQALRELEGRIPGQQEGASDRDAAKVVAGTQALPVDTHQPETANEEGGGFPVAAAPHESGATGGDEGDQTSQPANVGGTPDATAGETENQEPPAVKPTDPPRSGVATRKDAETAAPEPKADASPPAGEVAKASPAPSIRARVFACHAEHPDWTASNIARHLEIPTQRVVQAARRAGIVLPKGVPGRRAGAAGHRPSGRPRQADSLLSRIRAYVANHPSATSVDCAAALGTTVKKVRNSIKGSDVVLTRVPSGRISKPAQNAVHKHSREQGGTVRDAIRHLQATEPHLDAHAAAVRLGIAPIVLRSFSAEMGLTWGAPQPQTPVALSAIPPADTRSVTVRSRILALHRLHPEYSARQAAADLGITLGSLSGASSQLGVRWTRERGRAVPEQHFAGKGDLLDHYAEVQRRLGMSR